MKKNRTELVRMPKDFRDFLDNYKFHLQGRSGKKVTYPESLSKLLTAIKMGKNPFDFDL